MNAEITTGDIFELFMLENSDWFISDNPLDRRKVEAPAPPPIIAEKKPYPNKTNDLIEQASGYASQACSIEELNKIIAENPQFNIISNSEISNFFAANSNETGIADIFFVYTQASELKTCQTFLSQADLNKCNIINCSLTPIKSFLAPLDKQQQSVYFPFLQKALDLTAPKAILCYETTLRHLAPHAYGQKQIQENNKAIFPIYHTYKTKNIWLTILALKQYLK